MLLELIKLFEKFLSYKKLLLLKLLLKLLLFKFCSFFDKFLFFFRLSLVSLDHIIPATTDN